MSRIPQVLFGTYASAPPPAPLDLPALANLVARYRADSAVVVSGQVDTWNDTGPYGYHMTNTASGYDTNIVPNAIGSRSAVAIQTGYDSTGGCFKIAGVASSHAKPYSILAICNASTYFGGGEPMVASYWNGTDFHGLGCGLYLQSLPTPYMAYSSFQTSYEVAISGVSVDVPQVLLWERDNNDIHFYNLTAGVAFLGTHASVPSGEARALSMDLYVGGTRFTESGQNHYAWKGNINEVAFYDRLLTSGEKTDVYNYYTDYYLGS